MTIAALKEVLSDRIMMLKSGVHQKPTAHMEGRLEELQVCLGLVEKLQLDEEHPLLELRDGCVRRVPWGEQERHNWPDSTFSGLVWDYENHESSNQDESEPDVNRFDPSRC